MSAQALCARAPAEGWLDIVTSTPSPAKEPVASTTLTETLAAQEACLTSAPG